MNSKGFSTVEILIAFALLIIALSGILIVVFGNDGFALDSQLNSEALYYAEEALNNARAAASGTAFTSFFGTAATTTDIYTTDVEVTDLTPCKKLLTSESTWSLPLRPQSVTLSTVVVSLSEFLALGDDCSDEPTDVWEDPFVGEGPKVDGQGTDVDVDQGYAYITSVPGPVAGAKNKHDFWIVDLSDPKTLDENAIIGSVNIDGDEIEKAPFGLNAVDVVGDYAFVAHNASTSQLMVIDISDKTNPSVISAATRVLPGVGNSYPEGRSIYYYDGMVYIGTHETAGNEFHVYSVGKDDIGSPTNPVWRGSKQIDNNVHDIVVRDGYAYIATSGDARELQVLDVSNPASPAIVAQFNAGDTKKNDPDGTALYLLGNKIYLGRERSSQASENLFIIDTTNPTSPSLLGAVEVELNSNTEIVGIIVSGNLAFIASTNEVAGFQMWDISNPSDIKQWACLVNYPEKASGMDFDGKYFYVSNESNDALRVLWDNPEGTNSC